MVQQRCEESVHQASKSQHNLGAIPTGQRRLRYAIEARRHQRYVAEWYDGQNRNKVVVQLAYLSDSDYNEVEVKSPELTRPAIP